jgi:hypothetical protein
VAPPPEDDPPAELDEELGVSPEPHAQKVAAATETAKGASVRVEVFGRAWGRRATCTIHLKVTAGACFRPRKWGAVGGPTRDRGRARAACPETYCVREIVTSST